MENRRRNERAGYEDAYHAGYRFHYDLHRCGRNGFREPASPHMPYDCRRTVDVHMGREMELFLKKEDMRMDFKRYLISKIEDNEGSQEFHVALMERETKELAKLKEEHAILEALLKETESVSKMTADNEKASEPRQEELGIDMSPKEFDAFMKAWVMAHLKDERLCPGYVERIFNTAIDTYKRKAT